MPSAEKSSSEAMKVEVASLNEPKTSENAQKDNTEHNNGEKSIPPIQQALQIIQNKVRNLEKRKNKLDGYIKEEEDGKELSNEQKRAVLKYEEVTSQLGISKEFSKQFQVIAKEAAKEQKRLERKNAFLKQMQETAKVREVLTIQDLLRQLKNESIRNDFLNAQNGACQINAAEMDMLEQFSKYTTPVHPNFSNEPSFQNSAKTAADFLSYVVDGRTRQFLETGFTFDKIKNIFSRIQSCGYFEKDIKVVEEEQSQQPPQPSSSSNKSETPQPTDLDSIKDEIQVLETEVVSSVPSSIMPSAPLPTQIPNPNQLFNGGNVSVGMMPVQVQHAPIQVIPQQMPPPPQTVTAVENAFYNQMKYSQPQGPMNSNNYIEDFASANISFLQDSLVEQIPITAGSQSPQLQHQQQQKIPPNNMLNQQQQQQQQQHPKHSPIQQVHPSTNQHQQQQQQQQQQQPQQIPTSQQMTHNFPPGLKLQGNASNIPVSYSQTQQINQSINQQKQQQQEHHHQQQHHLINKESTQPLQEPPQQHYQTNIPSNAVQYQQQMPTNIPNLQEVEQKALNAHQQNIDVSSDKSTSDTSERQKMSHVTDKENHRSNNNEWNSAGNQQQPQIDTWNNDTPSGGGNSGSAYSRFGRGSRGSNGPKYNNYRNSQGTRNSYNNENGNGDTVNNREGSGSTTYFRNNERYNSGGNAGRYNNNMSDRGNFNKRDNYRTGGSGRFTSNSMGSSNPVQRK